MTIVDMLGQSGVLTLLGMGIVISFLVVLIVAITLVGKLLQVLGINKCVQQPPKSGGISADSSNNAAVTAAISAALTEFGKSQK